MKVVENFAQPGEINSLLDLCRSTNWNDLGGTGFWKNRACEPLKNSERYCLAKDLLLRMRSCVVKNSEYSRLYPDTLALSRWPIGFGMPPHADAENEDGTKHPVHWRKFATILYLNNDYSGGEIYFPNKGITLKPKPGTLLMFRSTLEWKHGVNPPGGRERFNLSSFWTDLKSKSIL